MLHVKTGPENGYCVVVDGLEGRSLCCLRPAPAQSLCDKGPQNLFVVRRDLSI